MRVMALFFHQSTFRRCAVAGKETLGGTSPRWDGGVVGVRLRDLCSVCVCDMCDKRSQELGMHQLYQWRMVKNKIEDY
jgi:hypothetical protein